MADRNTPESFTLEQWRVEFNELAVDVGDIANLPASIDGNAVTDVIEAIAEINTAISTTGIGLAADSGTAETLVISDTLTINGTANEIETEVSATDTITIGLPDDVTITNNLTVSNDLDVQNEATLASAKISDLTSGRVLLAGTSGEVEDNGNLTFDGTTLNVTGNVDVTGNITLGGNIIMGDADTDSIDFNADVISNIIPNAAATYDLGATGKEWQNIFMTGTLNNDLGISLSFPSNSGSVATEGFSVAMGIALG